MSFWYDLLGLSFFALVVFTRIFMTYIDSLQVHLKCIQTELINEVCALKSSCML